MTKLANEMLQTARELKRDVKTAKESNSLLNDLLSFPGWISIEDEIPDNGEEVIVRSFDRQVRQATRDTGYSGGWKQRNCSGWECLSHCKTFVTHFFRFEIPQP